MNTQKTITSITLPIIEIPTIIKKRKGQHSCSCQTLRCSERTVKPCSPCALILCFRNPTKGLNHRHTEWENCLWNCMIVVCWVFFIDNKINHSYLNGSLSHKLQGRTWMLNYFHQHGCALVSYQYVTHFPNFCNLPHENEQAGDTSHSSVCISMNLQCRSIGVPRLYRGRLLPQLYKRLCGLLTSQSCLMVKIFHAGWKKTLFHNAVETVFCYHSKLH